LSKPETYTSCSTSREEEAVTYFVWQDRNERVSLCSNKIFYSQGASTDAIYRVDSESLDWWQDTKQKCHAARWLFVLLVVLIVVSTIVYFLVVGEFL
jgi:hypothetical protein